MHCGISPQDWRDLRSLAPDWCRAPWIRIDPNKATVADGVEECHLHLMSSVEHALRELEVPPDWFALGGADRHTRDQHLQQIARHLDAGVVLLIAGDVTELPASFNDWLDRGHYEATRAGRVSQYVPGRPLIRDSLSVRSATRYLQALRECQAAESNASFEEAWAVQLQRLRLQPVPEKASRWPYRAPSKAPVSRDPSAWPKISIVTPSFQQGDYLEETILSVLRQGYPNVQHIVVDGGSTDSTTDVLRRYRSHLDTVISEPDEGQSHALQKGFSLARGEVLTWLNSDDLLAPGALAAVATAFLDPSVDLVAGICVVHRDGKPEHHHLASCADGILSVEDLLNLEGRWYQGEFFYQPEVFFRRSLWQAAGGLIDRRWFYGMDYDLWLRFAEQGAKLKVIGRPLAWFRSHDQQKTASAAGYREELPKIRDEFIATHQEFVRAWPTPNGRNKNQLRVLHCSTTQTEGRELRVLLRAGGHDVQWSALPVGGDCRSLAKGRGVHLLVISLAKSVNPASLSDCLGDVPMIVDVSEGLATADWHPLREMVATAPTLPLMLARTSRAALWQQELFAETPLPHGLLQQCPVSVDLQRFRLRDRQTCRDFVVCRVTHASSLRTAQWRIQSCWNVFIFGNK